MYTQTFAPPKLIQHSPKISKWDCLARRNQSLKLLYFRGKFLSADSASLSLSWVYLLSLNLDHKQLEMVFENAFRKGF